MPPSVSKRVRLYVDFPPTLWITHQLVGVRIFTKQCSPFFTKQCEMAQTNPLDHSPTSGGKNCEITSLANNVKSCKKKVNKMAQIHTLDHSPTSGGENCEIASLASNVKSYKKVSKMAQTHPLGHSPTCGGDNFHLTTHLWKTM